MKNTLWNRFVVAVAAAVISDILVDNARFLVVVQAEPIHEDVLVVLNVTGGVTPGGLSWADSYSVGNRCYCISTFDHNIGDYFVRTNLGWMTTRQACATLGEGPGPEGRPVYNDLQCGNGPPNDAGDEHVCPGRTDIGEEGCGHIGPVWNFEDFTDATIAVPIIPTDEHPDIEAVLNVVGGIETSIDMAESYSVNGRCYCMPTLNNGIGPYFVDGGDVGWMTVDNTCKMIGQGPEEGRVYYNDVQCGNGPPSAAGDEQSCPGRVDIVDGCGHIGPRWNFTELLQQPGNATAAPSASPISNPTPVPISPAPTQNSSTSSAFPSDLPSTMPSDLPSAMPTLTSSPSATPSNSSGGTAVSLPEGPGSEGIAVTTPTEQPTIPLVSMTFPPTESPTSAASRSTSFWVLTTTTIFVLRTLALGPLAVG